MSNPPGCPMRDVVLISPVAGGAYLKLSCGHSNWLGGLQTRRGQEHLLPRKAPCLQSPCYKVQRDMGDC